MYTAEKIRAGSLCELSGRYRGSMDDEQDVCRKYTILGNIYENAGVI